MHNLAIKLYTMIQSSRMFKGLALIYLLISTIRINAQITDEKLRAYQENENNFFLDGLEGLSTYDLIKGHISVLNIGDDDILKYMGYTADTNNYHIVIKFKQYHAGILVDKVSVSFTEKDNRIHSIMGNLVKGITVPTLPSISANEALPIALASTGASKFMWEVEEEETDLKDNAADSTATYYPKPAELVYTWATEQQNGNDYHLAWRYEIHAFTPNESYEVYIDAISGVWIKTNMLSMTCGQTGTCTTMYNGQQTISTHWRGAPNWNYVLKDCAGPYAEIETKWAGFNVSNSITNGSTTWDTDDQSATSSHWAARQAMTYFANTYGRNSVDNNGQKITIKADWGDENASWGGNTIKIGKRYDNQKGFGSLDIVGHEFTHGVVDNTADLIYEGESGALNESFADIFGEVIQHYTTGNTDWLFGSEIGSPHARSLSNPSAFIPSTYNIGQPKFYKSTGWYFGTADHGGVHQNSGVQNYWFYKLSNTLTIEKAAMISYYNLKNYLNSSSEYMNSRQGSIAAAKILYGRCSKEVKETIKAWYEVGVGSSTEIDPLCVSIIGPGPSFCNNIIGKTISATFTANCSSNTGAWTWVASPGIIYTTSGNQITITKFLNSTPLKYIRAYAYTTEGNTFVGQRLDFNFAPCMGGLDGSFAGHAQLNPDLLFTTATLRGSNESEFPKILINNSNISIYPNPAFNKINIEMPGERLATVILTDVQGRLLKKVKITSAGVIDVSDITAGLYFIKIISGSTIKTEKVIINH